MDNRFFDAPKDDPYRTFDCSMKMSQCARDITPSKIREVDDNNEVNKFLNRNDRQSSTLEAANGNGQVVTHIVFTSLADLGYK